MRSSSFGMLSSYLARRAGLETRHLLQQFCLRVGPERLASHQQFVEDDAQAENVAAAINPMPFATSLLGTHIGGRPGVAWSLAHVLFTQCQSKVCDERSCRFCRGACCQA